jgi:hypothetical protein
LFATGVNTGGTPDLRISPQIFDNIKNYPNIIFRGLGWGNVINEKNLKQKSHDTLPLTSYGMHCS